MDSNSVVLEIVNPEIKLDTQSETTPIKVKLNYKSINISNFSEDSVKVCLNIVYFIDKPFEITIRNPQP